MSRRERVASVESVFLEATVAAIVVLVVLALGALSCGGGGSGSDSPPRCQRQAFVGVNVVNGWPRIDAEQYASALEAACIGFTHIEAYPWVDKTVGCAPGLCVETYPANRRAFLGAMASRGITTLVTAGNSNSRGWQGLGDESFRQTVREIAEDAGEHGPLVWLGAPSEPWQWDKARGLERAKIARDEWRGVFVMPDAGANRATGRPYYPIAADLVEVHPCSHEAAARDLVSAPPNVIVITDCRPVLVPPLDKLADLTTLALEHKRVLGFYGWLDESPRYDAIAEVGRLVAGE